LAGVQFKAYSDSLVGVDLSPEMVEIARSRNIYDKLEVAEITEWLNRSAQSFDLIIACDTLIYFGDLSEIMMAAANRLNPGGLLAFTLERCDRGLFHLGDSGRFSHHRDHVRGAAEAANLGVALLQEGPLRMEYGEEVAGLFCCLEPTG
jgi:predicted TPR repeat methyltransferase